MPEAEQPDSSAEHQGGMESSPGHDPYPIRFYIEDPTGDVYRAEAQSDTLVRDVATDFFEERGWPARDQAGRPQRAVVERVDPENPERTERLRGDSTLHDAGVRDDDTVRVPPESVAGLFNPQERLRALVVDQREVLALADEDPAHIEITPNAEHAATYYEIVFRYPGIAPGPQGPEKTPVHRIEIYLPPDYPVAAPRVRWMTPIFHPNVSKNGAVCLVQRGSIK